MANSHRASLARRERLSVAGPKRAQSDPIDFSHPSSVDKQVTSDRPSIVRRIFRLPTFFFAVGIGATLGWQSYGDAARQIVAEEVPTLASLLPVSTTKSPALAPAYPEIVHQLLPLTFGIDVMRRSVDQLTAKQEQLAQNIAVLQAAVEEDVRQKVSSTPPTLAQQDASVQEPRLSQPTARSRARHSSSLARPPSETGFVSR